MVNVPYNGISTVSANGGGGTPMSVRSDPQDFGSQVGAAVEKQGNDAFDLAQKQQGMINETEMTNADTQMAIKAGQLNADYKSLSGLAAHAAFPKYQQDLEALRQETRSTLPPAAQRGFDTLSTRTIANHIIDGSTYAASQLKEANRDSFSSSNDLHIQQILQPDVARSDEQFQYNLDTIKYNTAAQLDEEHPGLKKDPESGEVRFDESTPEGQRLKEEYQRNLDANISEAYVNRYTALSKDNPVAAYDKYQKERDSIPRPAQVALDSSFAPKIFDAHKQTAVNGTVDEAKKSHYDILTNPGTHDSVSVIMKNELHADGVVRVHSDGDGSAIGGINSQAYPAQFLEAKAVLESQGQDAAKKNIQDFYRTEIIEKNGIDKLPVDVQDVVADGVTNHRGGFQKELITAAQDGASRQQLIDMRRNEYQRLADQNPAKYGQYLTSWNDRLDGLQESTEGKKTYATNENGGPVTLADYYRTHSQDVLSKGDAYAERQMPGDLTFKRSVRQTLQNQMSQTISNESAQHQMDNRNVMRAISGEMTKGVPPQTEEELRQLPGMDNLLDDISARDPKFAESVPTLIAKAAKRNEVTNSPNGYETVLRALQPHSYDQPNAIASQDHLHKLLARSDETGINMKDYNDAKAAIDLDTTLKTKISKHMIDITNANGNLDGLGQQRALQWYNQTMDAWKQNGTLGDKTMPASQFADSIGQKDGPPMPKPPSRIQQIINWAATKTAEKKADIPVLTDKSQFDALKSGDLYVRDGQQYRKP